MAGVESTDDLVNTSENIADLAKALSSAQEELTEAAKTSFNPGFKSKYADLAEVLQTIRPVAAKHGLSYVQGVGFNPDISCASVTTRLLHMSGQFIESLLFIPVVKKDPQGLGSALTYGRRYSLAAMFGISQDDDDGEVASPKPVKAKPKFESGSAPQTQGPPSAIAQGLIDRFSHLDPGPGADNGFGLREAESEMKLLTKEYASLTAAEQTQVLPHAKAARNRIESAARALG